tara:strand:- start:21797 stop:23011 length:1215 start_codon:yes stop_codon:yes gene_type:complete
MKCRFCKSKLSTEFVDLINQPPSNSYVLREQLNEPEVYYPLKIFVCSKCKLVQIDEYKKSNDIFDNEYAYFSSYSSSWLDHSKNYVSYMIEKLSLNNASKVTEIASNDGYLLQFFKEKNIPCLGIEPTKNTAAVAREKGIDVIEDFFGSTLAKTIEPSDLILGKNVLAHVPDINDFVQGLKIALKPKGTITMEFPHLLNLIQKNQFDTIYHEHFSYLSFYTAKEIFEHHGLKLYDVEKFPTHGGSIRIFATHEESSIKVSKNVENLINEERSFGICDEEIYQGFQQKTDRVKNDLLTFLLQSKIENKSVIAYGAAAKGNTLLNYAGVKSDLISFVVDKSPHKQGKYLPASHIPIVSEENITKLKPSYVLILPWNIQDEVTEQLKYIRKWGGKFVVAVPELKIFE